MFSKPIPVQTALAYILIALLVISVFLIVITILLVRLRRRLILASSYATALPQTVNTTTPGKKGVKDAPAQPQVIVIEEKAVGINWPFWGLVVSIILIILFSGGYYTYYLGAQKGSVINYSRVAAEEATAKDEITKNVEKAQNSLAGQETNVSNEVETKGWENYQNPSYDYTFQHPKDWKLTDYQNDWKLAPTPTNTSAAIRITKTDTSTATPPTDATASDVSIPLSSTNSFLQIRVMPNPDKLEPGAFASIYPAHDLATIKSRTAMQMYGLPAVRYITGNDTVKSEIVYVNIPETDSMYAIELRVPASASQDSADYRIYKKMIAVLKLKK